VETINTDIGIVAAVIEVLSEPIDRNGEIVSVLNFLISMPRKIYG
jgi:hypothetical protein